MANSFPRISAKTDRLDTELRERGFWGVAAWKTGAAAQSHGGGRGDGHNPSHANMARLSAARAEGYTQFLGSIRPRTGPDSLVDADRYHAAERDCISLA
jgi:hypothetical protein